jgi:hypothetical protein
MFTDGSLLIRTSEADLDTDGIDSGAIDIWDADHQSQTSIDPSGQWLGANEIPYVVLPKWLADANKFSLGTVCMVALGLNAETYAFGILADYGPTHKIGEASIQMWRLLGQERVKNYKVVNQGIDGPCRFLFFKNSAITMATNTNDIQVTGAKLLNNLLNSEAGK